MGELKKSISEYVARPLHELRFLCDGQRFNDDDTPESLEMEKEDVIDVFAERVGG